MQYFTAVNAIFLWRKSCQAAGSWAAGRLGGHPAAAAAAAAAKAVGRFIQMIL
jgi:hypothetical protein